jgi:hypothetical protein
MNKLVFVILIGLTAGCLVTQRNWNLGICRFSHTGSYNCVIRVPKSLAGVTLIAEPNPGGASGSDSLLIGELRIRLQNVDSHSVEILAFDKDNIRLNPGESVEGTTKSNVEKQAIIGFVDTSEGAIKLAVEILASSSIGEKVRIVGHSADAL